MPSVLHILSLVHEISVLLSLILLCIYVSIISAACDQKKMKDTGRLDAPKAESSLLEASYFDLNLIFSQALL